MPNKKGYLSDSLAYAGGSIVLGANTPGVVNDYAIEYGAESLQELAFQASATDLGHMAGMAGVTALLGGKAASKGLKAYREHLEE